MFLLVLLGDMDVSQTLTTTQGVAMAAVAVLLLSSFPPPNSTPDEQNSEDQ